jgi:hypothetical protein
MELSATPICFIDNTRIVKIVVNTGFSSYFILRPLQDILLMIITQYKRKTRLKALKSISHILKEKFTFQDIQQVNK